MKKIKNEHIVLFNGNQGVKSPISSCLLFSLSPRPCFWIAFLLISAFNSVNYISRWTIFLSPKSFHIVLNASHLKCLIKCIATFLGSFICPLIDIRKSDQNNHSYLQRSPHISLPLFIIWNQAPGYSILNGRDIGRFIQYLFWKLKS